MTWTLFSKGVIDAWKFLGASQILNTNRTVGGRHYYACYFTDEKNGSSKIVAHDHTASKWSPDADSQVRALNPCLALPAAVANQGSADHWRSVRFRRLATAGLDSPPGRWVLPTWGTGGISIVLTACWGGWGRHSFFGKQTSPLLQFSHLYTPSYNHVLTLEPSFSHSFESSSTLPSFK